MSKRELRKLCKKDAKQKLSDKWGICIGVMLVVLILVAAVNRFVEIPDRLRFDAVTGILETINYEVGDPLSSLAKDADAVIPPLEIPEELPEEIKAELAYPDWMKVLLGLGMGAFAEDDPRLLTLAEALLNPASWAKFVSILLYLSLLVFAVGLLAYLIKNALTMGRGKVFYEISIDKGKFSDCFHYFTGVKRFFRASWFVFLLSLVEAVISAVAGAIMGVGIVLSLVLAAFELPVFVCLLPTLIAVLGGLVLQILFINRLTMAPYLFFAFPDRTSGQAVAESWRLMKGHCWEIVVFELSYLGWEILSLFTFSLLQFYITPYKAVTLEHLMGRTFEKEKGDGKGSLLFSLPEEVSTDSGVTDWDGLNHLDEIKLPEGDNESNYSSEG